MNLSPLIHCLAVTAKKSSSAARGSHAIKLMQLPSTKEFTRVLHKLLLKIPLNPPPPPVSITVPEHLDGSLGRACYLSYPWLRMAMATWGLGHAAKGRNNIYGWYAWFLLWSCSQYKLTQIPRGKCASGGGHCFRKAGNNFSSQLREWASENQFIHNTLVTDLVLCKPTAESKKCKSYSREHLHEMQFHLEQHSSLYY